MEFKDPHNQNSRITVYQTEKNFYMLCRIISAATNPGDLVLDCFCGSGTTLEAALTLGRRFIGIDSSQLAINATVRRLKNGRERMGDFVRRANSAKQVHAPTLFDLHADHASTR